MNSDVEVAMMAVMAPVPVAIIPALMYRHMLLLPMSKKNPKGMGIIMSITDVAALGLIDFSLKQIILCQVQPYRALTCVVIL